MTIERIERISDYRIYRDFRWPSDLLDFSRYNLFYGWNGSGKTTLSSIFGSLQSRRSIFSSDIRLRIGCATLHGKDFETATSPPIRVFNRDTIDRTLFEDPHQELPPVYYLGEESAEKQREVVQLKAEVEITKEAIGSTERRATEQRRLREKFCTEQAANIKNMLTTSGGGPYNYYNKQLYKQDADKILNNQIPGFCLTAHEKKRCIDTKNGSPLDKVAPILLLEIDYQALIKQVESLLSRSIVSSVIDELNNSPVISSWVQAGLKLHTGDNETATCHFCKQEIPDNRISELEGHFSDQLSRFQSEIDQLIRKIEGYVKAIEQLALPAKSLFYPHLRKDYERNASNWIKARLSLVTFLKALVSALKKKRDEPFQQLDINEVIFSLTNASEDSGWIMKVLAGIFDVAQNAITLLGLQTITNINQLISGHNQYTDEFSNQVKKARSDLAMDMVARAISEYQDFKTTINQLEEEYSSKKDEISVKNSKIDDLERDIRQHRKAADELNEEMCAYLGRNELKFETSDNGYRITRNGEPAFHLSEGERTAISFMYFLKTLEDEDFNLDEGVVVIDDPISSLDSNSMYSAFGFMKEKTRDAKQLFILTHSFSFFRLVRGWFLKMPHMMKETKPHLHPARLYLLECTAYGGERSASIANIDPLLRNYESEYHYLFKTIHTEANKPDAGGGLEDYYGLPNLGRRLLESFLTFKLPHFEAGKLEKKMNEISFDAAKKTRILRFLHVNSHNDQIGAPEHDISILSETQVILRDLLELIEVVDKEHFDGMLTLLPIAYEEDQEESAPAS